MPEDLLCALNLLAKAIQVRRSQIDKHIGYVEQVRKDVQKSIGWIEHRLVDLDAHGDENDRIDGNEYDHVRPALAPRVVTGDKKSVLLLVLQDQVLALLLLLLIQVLNHHLDRRLAVGELLGLGLLDDVLELLLLVFSELLQSQFLRIQLLLPVADLKHFVALRLHKLLMSLLELLHVVQVVNF